MDKRIKNQIEYMSHVVELSKHQVMELRQDLGNLLSKQDIRMFNKLPMGLFADAIGDNLYFNIENKYGSILVKRSSKLNKILKTKYIEVLIILKYMPKDKPAVFEYAFLDDLRVNARFDQTRLTRRYKPLSDTLKDSYLITETTIFENEECLVCGCVIPSEEVSCFSDEFKKFPACGVCFDSFEDADAFFEYAKNIVDKLSIHNKVWRWKHND